MDVSYLLQIETTGPSDWLDVEVEGRVVVQETRDSEIIQWDGEYRRKRQTWGVGKKYKLHSRHVEAEVLCKTLNSKAHQSDSYPTSGWVSARSRGWKEP